MLLALLFFFWILPIVTCCWYADANGYNIGKVFVCAFIAGWIGGILALVLLEPESEPSKSAQEEADERNRQAKYEQLRAHRAREDAVVKSERVQKLYDELVLGKKPKK